MFRKGVLMAWAFVAVSVGMFTSCDSDDVGGNLFTFTDKMMGQYLIENKGEYSEFATLLDTTDVMGLVNSYGTFTCFAPDNAAMKRFYAAKNKRSLADFSMDSLRIIAYDHIINGTQIIYAKFPNGRLSELSMSDRFISISFPQSGLAFVNKSAQIVLKDIMVYNGVIHRISEVLNPTRFGIVAAVASDPSFSLFYEALVATGLADSLVKERDDTYNPLEHKKLVTTPLDAKQWFYQEIPAARKYGYTLLMESNSTMQQNGITDLASMKDYAATVYNAVYPADANVTDITDRRNSLNRFIAYHIINKQLSFSKFIDDYDTDHMLKNRDMFEYIETMCPNTLMEIKKERLTNGTKHINYLRESGKSVKFTSNYDKDATNGVYHEINDMLVYSQDVENELSGKRLRFDAASFFPELTNNNMRGSRFKQNSTTSLYSEPSLHYQLPRNYIDRIKSSEQTVVGYLCGYPRFQNYMADEIFLASASGKLYDFSIITPPVPAGTYEVRFGYTTNGKRGVAQLYFDNVPAGVPLNLNTLSSDVNIGYEAPGSVAADPEGFENDKMMRNRGYMKGPASFKVAQTGWTSGENSRYSTANLRRILGTYTFREAGHHILTVKGLSGGEFMFDYLEFVPTSAIETEDIY